MVPYHPESNTNYGTLQSKKTLLVIVTNITHVQKNTCPFMYDLLYDFSNAVIIERLFDNVCLTVLYVFHSRIRIATANFKMLSTICNVVAVNSFVIYLFNKLI